MTERSYALRSMRAATEALLNNLNTLIGYVEPGKERLLDGFMAHNVIVINRAYATYLDKAEVASIVADLAVMIEPESFSILNESV